MLRLRRCRPAASRGRRWRRMPRAISAAMPWPLGGISCRRWPQASMPIVSTHSGSNDGEVAHRHRPAVALPHALRRGRRSRRRRARRRASRRSPAGARAGGRKGEALADLGRPALRQEGLGPAGLARASGAAATHFSLNDDRHGIAALGGLDRRREQVGERQLAEALGQARPSRRRRPARSTESQPRFGGWPRRRRTCGGSSPGSTPPAPGPRR